MPARENIRRFQFLREIASGGFGSVFLTKVMHSDGFSRIAAVKLLLGTGIQMDKSIRGYYGVIQRGVDAYQGGAAVPEGVPDP